MNKIVVSGNLTRSPEKIESNKDCLVKLCLAVNDTFEREDGSKDVDYFNIAVWGKVAENCLKYLDKGSRIIVCGKMKNHIYEKDGDKKIAPEIVAQSIEFIGAKKD